MTLVNFYCCLVDKLCMTLLQPIDYRLARQAPITLGFPSQEYWSELPFPSPGDLPDPGIEHVIPELQMDSLTMSHNGGPSEL